MGRVLQIKYMALNTPRKKCEQLWSSKEARGQGSGWQASRQSVSLNPLYAWQPSQWALAISEISFASWSEQKNPYQLINMLCPEMALNLICHIKLKILTAQTHLRLPPPTPANAITPQRLRSASVCGKSGRGKEKHFPLPPCKPLNCQLVS